MDSLLPTTLAGIALGAPLLLPRPRLAAGITAGATALTAGLCAQRSWSLVVPWIFHNGQPLVEVGLRPTPLGAAVLAAAALGEVLVPATAPGRRPLALGAAGVALLAPDLVQGFLGLALVGLLSVPLAGLRQPAAARAWMLRRLADSLALLGLAALHQHTTEFGVRAPILPDSPQSTLIAALLVAAAGASTGVLPWPAPRRADRLSAAVGLALLWQLQQFIRVAPAVGVVLGLLAALSLARLGLGRASLQQAWPALVVLVLAQGRLALAALGVLLWPLVAISAGPLVVLLPGAVLAGEALSTFADEARWLPLALLGAGLLGLGAGAAAHLRAGRAPAHLAVAALGLLGVAGLGALARFLAIPLDLPPLWAPPLAALLGAAGGVLAGHLPQPVLPSLWGLSWREGLRPLAAWLGRWR